MNAPLIWIGSPLAMALLLSLLRWNRRQIVALAGGFCLLLAFLAAMLPIDSALKLGPLTLEISSSYEILGRRFLLDSSDLSFLVLLYSVTAFWLFGASMIRTPRYFLSVSMLLIAFSIAALAVEPFLYAALLVEVVVLVSIPILSPTGKPPGQGILRYLIFQTLALPFILFAGWSAAGVEANPADSHLLLQTLSLLGVGFALWLAVFPFYTWVPLLAGESHPYVAGFILNLLPTVILLLMLTFLDAFGWLWADPLVPQVLRLMGAIMVVTGGFWALFQNNLTRLFGYAVIIESGFSLLALSLANGAGLEIFAGFFLPRALALGAATLALSSFPEGIPRTLHGLRGILRRMPVTSGALLVALFSLGGIPLLGGFPLRQLLLESLAQKSLGITIWVLAGNLGFLAGVIRAAAIFLQPPPQDLPSEIKDPIGAAVLLGVSAAFLFLIGLFPHIFLSSTQGLLKSFSHIY